MVKEEKYYFEVHFLERAGANYFGLWMKTPTQSSFIPVSFNHLEPYAPNWKKYQYQAFPTSNIPAEGSRVDFTLSN